MGKAHLFDAPSKSFMEDFKKKWETLRDIKMEEKDIATLYLCEREGETYSAPMLLLENINSKSWETGATISADGKTFYFVSDRPEGYGGGVSIV